MSKTPDLVMLPRGVGDAVDAGGGADAGGDADADADDDDV